MIKNIISILTACIVFAVSASAMEVEFHFDTIEYNNNIDMLGYDVMYIDTVDTSEVTPDIYDPGGDYEDPDDLKRDIAFAARKRFLKNIKRAMPVEGRKKNLGDKKVLVLNLKLIGEYRDTRMLENVLPGTAGREVGLTLEATISDMKTGDVLAKVVDVYEGRSAGKPDELELRLDDLDQWYKSLDFWANELTRLIAYRRGTLMPIAPRWTQTQEGAEFGYEY